MPWETLPDVWNTQAKFFAWLRGGIRGGIWNKYPVKLEYLKQNRKMIKNPNPRGRKEEVWGGECYVCGGEFPQSKLQVDHREGNHSLREIEDIQEFIEAMILVTMDDLGLICKECHDIKSYQERHGITFEEAKVAKDVIAYMKNTSISEQRKVLKEHGLPENNASVRKEGLTKLFSTGKIEV